MGKCKVLEVKLLYAEISPRREHVCLRFVKEAGENKDSLEEFVMFL